jgi:hypothetical protein
MVFGGAYLLAFSGGLVLFLTFKSALMTEGGVRRHIRTLKAVTTAVAGLAWSAVISGTYIAYPLVSRYAAGGNI